MTQWTHVPIGASGSSQISARLLAAPGTPVQFNGGEASSPSQVCFAGINSPSAKAELVSGIVIAAFSFVEVAVFRITMSRSPIARIVLTNNSVDFFHGIVRLPCEPS